MSIQEQFWNWFRMHENKLFDFESNQEAIFDEISTNLQAVDSDLSFEFGPIFDGKREFAISASGIRRAFPAVLNLVEAAPRLERWKITAFRPRRDPLYEIELRGMKVSPDKVEFALLNKGSEIGIYLFIPSYTDRDPDYKQLGYLLLDNALGEFDVETKIGMIKLFPWDSSLSIKRYPWHELPGRFDELIKRLGEADDSKMK